MYIKDTLFYEFELKIVAAASIAFLRKINGISPFWNLNLTKLSQVSEDNI